MNSRIGSTGLRLSASDTRLVSKTHTFVGSGATVNVPLFRVTGTVRILRIWGVVTVVIGPNHTGGFWRLNDGAAPANITDNAVGATLSARPVGTKLVKTALLAVVATVTTSAAGAVSEPAAAEGLVASEFECLQKSATNTDIEYTYTTTDTPTSGAMQFFCEWQPRSADANLAAL